MLQNKQVITYKCDVEGCPSVRTIDRKILNDADVVTPTPPPNWISVNINRHICDKHKFEIKVDDKVVSTNVEPKP